MVHQHGNGQSLLNFHLIWEISTGLLVKRHGMRIKTTKLKIRQRQLMNDLLVVWIAAQRRFQSINGSMKNVFLTAGHGKFDPDKKITLVPQGEKKGATLFFVRASAQNQ